MRPSTESFSLSRRSMLKGTAASAACALTPTLVSAWPAKSGVGSRMGLVIYDCNLRRKWMQKEKPGFDLFEPLTFLKYCQSQGAGGMQASLRGLDGDRLRALREFATKNDLFVEAIVRPPASKDDLSRFEAEIRAARDAGAQAARTTIIPGRRYERFQTLTEFREYERRGRQMLERAAPIVEKLQVPLAVENHKDQRIEERVALFKELDSEFIGACLDTGNSFALLDGAYEPIEALAPYAFTVHLKDQALQEYEDGFLLGDIPLGQGSFDLKRMVDTVRKAKPQIRFSLELLTRDPLKVPCLTEPFYATMPKTPALDVARAMQFVRAHAVKDLQYVSKLPREQQVRLEDANVAASLKYARGQLGL